MCGRCVCSRYIYARGILARYEYMYLFLMNFANQSNPTNLFFKFENDYCNCTSLPKTEQS